MRSIVRNTIATIITAIVIIFVIGFFANGCSPEWAKNTASNTAENLVEGIKSESQGFLESVKDIVPGGTPEGQAEIEEPEIISTNTVIVERVIDGDTFKADGETIRLIGCDTPESKHPDADKNVEFGITATEYTKNIIDGKQVQLIYDVEERDRYGRILAYVYTEDGIFLNELLISEGLARVMTVPPNVAHKDTFTAAQESAREQGKGIWQDYENAFPE